MTEANRSDANPGGDLFAVDGKVVLVTGGSSGIGRMIAEGFVRAGADVLIASRKMANCDAVAQELSEFGTCSAIEADVSTEPGCIALAAAVAERHDRLDVLVNNSGTNWGAPFAEYPDSAWDKVLSLNVKSPFLLTRALIDLLDAAASPDDPARVINIGSVDGLHAPLLETYAYSVSKAGVHHLTKVLARQLAARHITVNAIAPGPFESRMMHETLERLHDAIVMSVPLRRIGRPSDMAGVAQFLASPAASYITGAVLPVDGGMVTTL